jgi:deoxyhypusine synthase
MKIEGYDFDKGIDYHEILKSYSGMGLQASNFGKAIGIVNEMIANKSKIYLSYTSNMVSSGVRDIIRYLVKNKKVDFLVTSGGGIEEDIVKCLKDFEVGEFNYDAVKERNREINMAGNIKIKDSGYMKFEKISMKVLEKLYKRFKSGERITPSKYVWAIGEEVNDERSIYYWAYKNKIPVYCHAISDGAIGSNLYFFQHKKKDFVMDLVEDNKELNDSSVGLKKSGVICLGGGVPKHAVMMANIYRNGADYAVYINTGLEAEGSDSGASTNEAITWGKLKSNAKSVKVFSEASLVFPLLVAETFAK